MGAMEAKAECKRVVVADEILTRISDLAERSVTTKERLINRLIPIMSTHAVDNPSEKMPEREYPPLFNDLRKHLITIEQSLSIIEDAIDRTEL